jgi:hypothetical protein
MYGYESSVTLTTDYTINYRPVLSSERAHRDEEQSNLRAKEREKKNLVMGPKAVPTPSRLTVGHDINSRNVNEDLFVDKPLHVI